LFQKNSDQLYAKSEDEKVKAVEFGAAVS
jgi:hypothetical protein